mgnify:CR=1 FL=1
MLDFQVGNHSGYKSLNVSTDTVNESSVNSGLLDPQERISMAIELIYAAEQLLPAGTGGVEHNLSVEREKLEGGD